MKQHTIRIPVHSITDLITNSSTTIFTYSGGSEPAVIELIDEMLATFGVDEKSEDIFHIVVLADSYVYGDYIKGVKSEDVPEGLTAEDVTELYNKVKRGEVEKPKWFYSAEEEPDGWTYYTPDTYLHLTPKKPEYKQLGIKLKNFLYSTGHEATYEG